MKNKKDKREYILTAPREEECIGCYICVIKSSIINSSYSEINLQKAFINIEKIRNKFKINLDYGRKLNKYEAFEIKQSCPKDCFGISKLSK